MSLQSKRKLANLRDGSGRPAIFFAAVNNDLGLLKLLISNGADPRAIDKQGRCILHYAAMNGGRSLLIYIIGLLHRIRAKNLTHNHF